MMCKDFLLLLTDLWTVCRTIYEKLASAFTEEQAVLYHQRVEEISPNIRYCAYNIGEKLRLFMAKMGYTCLNGRHHNTQYCSCSVTLQLKETLFNAMLNMSAVGMKVHLTEEPVACLFTPEHACGQAVQCY